MKVKNESEVAQLCRTLCGPVDCSLPGSSRPWDFAGKSTGVGCRCLLHSPCCSSHVRRRERARSAVWPPHPFLCLSAILPLPMRSWLNSDFRPRRHGGACKCNGGDPVQSGGDGNSGTSPTPRPTDSPKWQLGPSGCRPSPHAEAGRIRVQSARAGSEDRDRKSTRLNSSHLRSSRMPSSA